MASKTNIDNYAVKEMVSNVFTSNDFDIMKDNASLGSIMSVLNIDFYCFMKNETATGLYGMTSDEQDAYVTNVLSSLGKKAKALVEVRDVKPISSTDIDGGNFTATITFFISANNVGLLSRYVSYLRDTYTGKYEEGINIGGDTTSIMMSFGDLLVTDYQQQTPMGKANICTLDIDFGYLLQATNYTSERFSLSTDNSTFIDVPYSKASIGIAITTESNTVQNNPKATGEIPVSSSLGLTITYYEFTKFPILTTIRNLSLGLVSTNNDDYSLTIPVYCKYTNTEDESEFTYSCILTQYTKEIINTDFSVVSIALKLNGIPS